MFRIGKDRDLFVRVSHLNDETFIIIREYDICGDEKYPTEKGIRLTLPEFGNLKANLPCIHSALLLEPQNDHSGSWFRIGNERFIYASVSHLNDQALINICESRDYGDNIEITLTLPEFENLKATLPCIHSALLLEPQNDTLEDYDYDD